MELSNQIKNLNKKLDDKLADKSKEVLIGHIKEQNSLLGDVLTELEEIDKSIAKSPPAVNLKRPKWYKEVDLPSFLTSVASLFDNLLRRDFKVDLDRYRSAKEAIAVRISNGNAFVEAIGSGVAAGMTSMEFPEEFELKEYKVNDFVTTSDILYVGKENKEGDYLMMKLDDGDMSYATIKNNAGVTGYSSAWAARLSLNYAKYSEVF